MLRPSRPERSRNTGRTNRQSLHVELLEGRLLLAPFTVMNTMDSGSGSLREAIMLSNSSAPGQNTISFAAGVSGTIKLESSLPTITHPVIINGPTKAAGQITIFANGTAGNGLVLDTGSDGSTIENLTIAGFVHGTGSGIYITTNNNLVEGDTLLVDLTGVQLGPVVGQPLSGNTIGGTTDAARNFIYQNTQDGVAITGNANLVEGNVIGANPNVPNSFGNAGNGISILGDSNTIGGTAPGARNVINSSGLAGTLVMGNENVVEGNFIGTDVSGLLALPNSGDGVDLSPGFENTIGGTASGAANVISGNQGSGIRLFAGSSSNVVQGNLVGIDASGSGRLPNSGDGLDLTGMDTTDNTIGGTADGAPQFHFRKPR